MTFRPIAIWAGTEEECETEYETVKFRLTRDGSGAGAVTTEPWGPRGIGAKCVFTFLVT